MTQSLTGDWNPGPPALEASTLPLDYRGGGSYIVIIKTKMSQLFHVCICFYISRVTLNIDAVFVIYKATLISFTKRKKENIKWRWSKKNHSIICSDLSLDQRMQQSLALSLIVKTRLFVIQITHRFVTYIIIFQFVRWIWFFLQFVDVGFIASSTINTKLS